LAVQSQDLDKIKIDFKNFKPENYLSFIAEGGIFLDESKEAGYKEARIKKR